MSIPADQAAQPAPAPAITLAVLQKQVTALTDRVTALEAEAAQMRQVMGKSLVVG